MEEGRGHGRHLQNVYDIASALPGTTPAPSTSVRSGRRTGSVTTNRIAKEDALGGEVRPLCIRPHRGVSSTSSRSSGAGDRPRTLHRLPTATNVRDIDITLSMSKTAARGTAPRKARVVDGNRVQVQKSRLVPNQRTIFIRFPDLFRLTQAG
jgi:hypothetical protein